MTPTTHPTARRVAQRQHLAPVGEGYGPQRRSHQPGESFNAGKALRTAGLSLRDEARGLSADAGKVGRGLGRVGAGDFTGSAGNVFVVVLGGILGLLLLDLLVSGRGSKITGAGLQWTGAALQRLVSPTDPLTAPGSSSTASAAGPSGSGASAPNRTPAAAGGTGTTPGAGRYGEPLYPRPTGVLAPAGGSSHTVDSAYVGLVGWIVKAFGVTVTSGDRSKAANDAAGGAPNSDHLRGLAVDFGGSAAALERLYRWAVSFGFPYVESPAQTVAAGEPAHVHISFYRPSN